MQEQSPSGIYQFGPFRLESGWGLFRGGCFLPLPPKELAVLEVLVGLEGKLASHDVLLERVWRGQEISGDSLTRCVYVLRRILGGDKQAYIATVSRKGYRLAVPVSHVPSSSRLSMIEKSIKTSPRAYAEYLEGLREANQTAPRHQQRAINLFESAHRLDPDFAVPLGDVAGCRIYQVMRGYVPPREGVRSARDICERALHIDPELVSALVTLGWIEGVSNRDFDTAMQLLDKALILDPEYARGHTYRAWVLRAAGLLADAVESARTATALDPHSVLYVHTLGLTLFFAGEYEQALELERGACREFPWNEAGFGYTALVASWLGLEDEAITSAYRAVELTDNDPFALALLAYVLCRTGHQNEGRPVAVEAEASEQRRAPRTWLAMVYAELCERDRVLDLLREARDEGCPWFPSACFDPRLGEFAHDPAVIRLF